MPPKVMTDPNWRPRAGELTWTRFDRSTARALGVIARLAAEEGDVSRTDSVYCDMDLPDRYAIACLDGEESHVYVPRHYMKPFDVMGALGLKCMKVRAREVRNLTPWDREKRRAIKAALQWLQIDEKDLAEKAALAARAAKKAAKTKKEEAALKEINGLSALPDVPAGEPPTAMHDFVGCPECCDEGSDAFWAALKLTRGDAHIRRKDSLEKRRHLIKLESEERDKILKERELRAQKQEDARSEDPGSSSTDHTSDSSSDEDDDDDDDSEEDDEDSSSSEISTVDAEDDDDDDDDDDDEDVEMKSGERKRAAPRRKRRRHASARKPYLSSSSEETEAEDDDEHVRKKRRKRV